MQPAGSKVALCSLRLMVCLWVGMSPLITCEINMSRTLLQCDWHLTTALNNGIATMSSLTLLRVQDNKEQRQHDAYRVQLTD